jgi:protein-tyrosine phosphatase
MIKVLFVCLGNICRSPTAHGVFEQVAAEQIKNQLLVVDSCGTAAWHIDNPPDNRSTLAAKTRGFELSHLRARQLSDRDFYDFDYILAMDKANLKDIQAVAPNDTRAHISLFLDFSDTPRDEVPDPYYGGDQGFEQVLDLVESGSHGLLAHMLTRNVLS